jgi:hypothetical protein
VTPQALFGYYLLGKSERRLGKPVVVISPTGYTSIGAPKVIGIDQTISAIVF